MLHQLQRWIFPVLASVIVLLAAAVAVAACLQVVESVVPGLPQGR